MAHQLLIALSDVAQHKGKQDCWLVIRGKVLDVTKFLQEHPGGEDVLLNAAGEDATEKFDDIGHSDYAKTLMNDYVIGAVEGYKTDALDKGDELVRGVAKTREYSGSSPWLGFLRYLFPILVLGIAFALRFLKNDENTAL